MFKKTTFIAMLLGVMVGANIFFLIAQAQSVIFGKATIAGSGCSNTQQIIMPDGKTISISLDKFVAENGQRANCIVRIPITIPSGYQIEVTNITYKGSRKIAQGGTGFFKTTYSVDAQTLEGANLDFTQGTGSFVTKAPFDIGSMVASCQGVSTNLGINMNAYASEGSVIAMEGNIKFTLQLKKC